MVDVKLEVIDLPTGQSVGMFSLTLCEAKAYELDTGSYRFRATYLITGEVQEFDRSITEGENPPLDFVFVPPPSRTPTMIFGNLMKTALNPGQENHFWGQLGDGTIGLAEKLIYINIDGVTKLDARPFGSYSYPVTTLADGGFDLCWYMDDIGVFQVAAEFLGDAQYAPSKSPVILVNVGNAPIEYKPPGPNTPTFMTVGLYKTQLARGSENHIWGQLGDGIKGVPSQPIYVNINGQTKTDARPFNPPQYAYPVITDVNGGFDLCWCMDDVGTFEVAAEFKGADFGADGSLLPVVSAATSVTVIGMYVPPTAPVMQNTPNSDPRIRNDRVAISLLAQDVLNPARFADYLASKSAWTRVEINWQNLEGNGDGVYHWNDGAGIDWDLVIDKLFTNHIAIVGLLGYGNPHYTGAWNNPPVTQVQIDAWLRWVRAVVERYKDKIAYWEIWNEPNAPGFWGNENVGPGMGGNAVEYANLLKQTSTLIRSIDPTAKIMTAGFWGSDCAFIKALYDAGCKDYFDVMTLHPYGGIANFAWSWYNLQGWNPDTWGVYSPFDFPVQAKVYELMRYYSDGDKPIWITEYGDWSSGRNTSGAEWGDYKNIVPVELWDVGLKMAWNFINDKNIDFAWVQNLYIESGYKTLGNIDKFIVFTFAELYNADGTKNAGYGYFQQLASTYNTEMGVAPPPPPPPPPISPILALLFLSGLLGIGTAVVTIKRR